VRMRSLPGRFLCPLMIAAVVGCAVQSAQNAQTSDAVPVLQARAVAVGVPDTHPLLLALPTTN